jgi:tRNA dimethylallyltransferase
MKKRMSKTLIIIIGPTSIGKTALSIQVAQHFNTEIISADSRQIYKELHIGTAVPSSHELHTVKHNLVQNHSIHEYYNASHFEAEAIDLIQNIFIEKNIAVMTGGSMLYIDVVCHGIDDLPTIDQEIRSEIILKFENDGIDSLRRELKKIDPEYYQECDLKNHKRIMHALEIYYMTGRKYSSFRNNTKKERNFDILKIGLNIEREKLHDRINNRVDQMINDGLIEEARSVYPFKNLNSLNTVGYKEIFDYFDNKISKEKAIELIKRNSRRYARRQLTWFNRDAEINWFDIATIDEIIPFIENKMEMNQKIS